MVCCKAEEHGHWCAAFPTEEYENKEYCKFHIPKASPSTSGDIYEFNRLIFDYIDQAKEGNITAHLEGTIFPGDIDFSRYTHDYAMPSINLNNAIFE